MPVIINCDMPISHYYQLLSSARIRDMTVVDDTAYYLADCIRDKLAESKSVLWLVSGGSAMEAAAAARNILGDVSRDSVLHVGLIDERYGPVGHKDSNYQQLLDAGFRTDQLIMHAVLHDGVSRDTCTAEYSQTLQTLFANVGYTIGLFGMGADGHTAGLLPDSPLTHEDTELVGTYTGPDFERISITPAAIRRLDEAVLFAVGQSKWPALQQFLQDGPTDAVPVRILKTAQSYTLRSDYQKEAA